MSRKSSGILAWLLVGVAMHLAAEGASAQLNQSGPISRFDSQDEISNQLCTFDTSTWTTVADRTFAQGGMGPSPVVVTFSGIFNSAFGGPDQAQIRLRVGRFVQDHSGGGIQMYDNDDDAQEAHSYTFITDDPGISPGPNKRIRVDMLSTTGNGVCVDKRALVILHK